MTKLISIILLVAGGLVFGPILYRIVERSLVDISDCHRTHVLTAHDVRRRAPRGKVVLAVATALTEGLTVGHFGFGWTFAPIAFFLPGMVALAWSDFEFFVLPKRIQRPTTTLVLACEVAAASATGEWHRLEIAAICAVVASVAFTIINLASPKAMAFGDVRLAGSIGLVTGWLGWLNAFDAFALALLSGALVAVCLLVAGRVTMRSRLPYGVFLAFGATVMLLV